MNDKTGSAIGRILGTVVLAATCGAVGWVGNSMYAKPKAKAASASAQAQQAAMMGAPQTVAVTTVTEKAYNLPERFVAHAEPLQEVDLLPQVDGYVQEIKFKEGDVVTAGQLLYTLDDEKYRAVVGQAKADLNAAEAESRRASRYFDRMQNADARGITQLERDNAEAAAEKATAAVLQAKANLVVAEYNCKKAKVYAPISGKIGKSNAHIGDYVGPAKGALAHIVQIDPIRVTFPMTDRAFLARVQAIKAGHADDFRIRLVLADGSEYDQKGVWDFDDNEMSLETASIMMRVSFPNPDRLLVPNAYVTVLTDLETPPSYPTVPQTAIVDLPGGNMGVFVLGEGDVVKSVAVETKAMCDGFVPVVKGLKVGDRVVTSGTGKLRDGQKVVFAEATPNEENMPGYKGVDLN